MLSWNKKYLKHLSIGSYEIAALVIIALAVLLRIFLIVKGWPATDSDEGTMGLEAMHIAFRGEHPVFLYGQNYMGTIEAYLGALLFRLFGASLFSLARRYVPVNEFALHQKTGASDAGIVERGGKKCVAARNSSGWWGS